MAKVRNIKLDINNIEYLEPRHPNSFNNLSYMNYSKIDILRMYVSLYNNHFKLKAMNEEVELKSKIYEKKLAENKIDVAFDEEETQEYIHGAKALIRSSSKTFEEELNKELGTYDEKISFQISLQLEKAMTSYKNTTGFSLIKANHQIEILEDLLQRTYDSKSLNVTNKSKQALALTAELRMQYAAKEKLLGRDVKKTAHINVGKLNGSKEQNNEDINWKEMKEGIVLLDNKSNE